MEIKGNGRGGKISMKQSPDFHLYRNLSPSALTGCGPRAQAGWAYKCLNVPCLSSPFFSHLHASVLASLLAICDLAPC